MSRGGWTAAHGQARTMAGSTSAGERERRRGQVRRGGCAGHQLASDMHNRYISRTATLNTEANKSNIQMKIFFNF